MIRIRSLLVTKQHLDLTTSHKFLILVCFSMSYTSLIEQVTEDYFTKHTNITTTYKDNSNGKYLQKLLNCQAGRLGFRDQVV
jgi:hypothetical protein